MKGASDMILEKGENVHIIVRKSYEGDVRRQFAGTAVSDVEGNLVRIQGYAFVFDSNTNSWEKRPEKRTRIFSLADGRHIVNVIPSSVDIEKLHYAVSREGHLVVTDGAGFSLDINEFGMHA